MSDVLSAVSDSNLKDFTTDGWIKNYGYMPVAGNVIVDTKFENGTEYYGDSASSWGWDSDAGISHWRLHNAACGNPPKSLETAYDHLNTGNWQDMPLTALSKRMSAAEYIKSLEPKKMSVEDYVKAIQPKGMTVDEYVDNLLGIAQPLVDEQPIGLPLSRVCKAFEAITGKPMSEEHAETFLNVVEMCKLYATEDDSL